MREIDDILVLTDQVQQYIGEGRWAEAGSLEKERLVRLNELFARDDLDAIRPECEQLTHDLLARNARMTETVQAGRRGLHETTRRVNAAAGAVGAYRRNEPAAQWGDKNLPKDAISD